MNLVSDFVPTARLWKNVGTAPASRGAGPRWLSAVECASLGTRGAQVREVVRAGISRITRLRWAEVRDRICFLHLPKCGGTSIERAIARHFIFAHRRLSARASQKAAVLLHDLKDPRTTDRDVVLGFREQLLIYHMCDEPVRFISGHFAFSEALHRNFGSGYAFVTVLREPVERWLSYYFYHRYKTHSDHGRISEGLESFAASERGRALGQTYVKMLGSVCEREDHASREAIDRAKANLHHFTVVGLLEGLDLFRAQFRQRFGVTLNLPRLNRRPRAAPSSSEVVTAELRSRIAEVCRPDQEVYDYAARIITGEELAETR